jgi:hypothetical protein
MKTRNLVKSGLAMTSAVTLLLISALFPLSTALAGGSNASSKLYSTGVEPHASGQIKASLSVFTGASSSYMVTVTVMCKGLTPGQVYTISSLTDGYAWWCVANPRGELSVTWSNFTAGRGYWVAVSVEGPLGTVLQGGVRL